MKTVTVVVLVVVFAIFEVVVSDPQTDLLNEECSQFKTNDMSNFGSNFNKTFGDIRKELSEYNTKFATAFETDVFGMAQCRRYLSDADCLACFDAGVMLMRQKCPEYDGAHVIYQGCFLRYEAHNFYSETTFQDNSGVCSNRTVTDATTFDPLVQKLLSDLQIVTPKIKDYFAVTSREAVGGGGIRVYAVAQCVETLSQSDCSSCLTLAYNNIQNCPPQAGASSINLRCFMRYSDTSFFAINQTTDITPYLKGGGGSSSKTAIIGGVGGGLCLLFLVLALVLWYWLFRKPTGIESGDILGLTKLQGPAVYSYKALKAATHNFSDEYKVGAGGFGDVYKGVIKNGDTVAVKKLSITSTRGKAEFESEIRLISNVHHRNIIRLLGCSAKGSDFLLVYEYMPNGSLDRFLYGEKRGTLNWTQRVDIILGIAKGLAYLHDEFHLCIIHRDIKSSNILLDDDFQPKIADFGLARLLPNDQTHLTTRFAGTMGYTAPEYAIHGHLSEKVDTFSFGVVVLEIISAQRCNDVKIEFVNESLLEYAWKLYEKDMHFNLVDESMDPSEYKVENVKKIIEIALMCTQSPTSIRPTMSQVVVLLTNDRPPEEKPPTKPTLVHSNNMMGDKSTSTASTTSNATATFTNFTGR